MELKTYRAGSMAEALAEVKKDLGKDAVILHARTFKVGGVMGVGARTVVEITASSDQRAPGPRPRAGSAPRPVAAPSLATSAAAIPAVARAYGATVPARQTAVKAAEPPSERFEPIVPRSLPPESVKPRAVAPAIGAPPPPPDLRPPSHPLATRVAIEPQSPADRSALYEELASIKRLVGEVLQATRPSNGVGASVSDKGLSPGVQACMERLRAQGVSEPALRELEAAIKPHCAEGVSPESLRRICAKELASLVPISPPPARVGRSGGRPYVMAMVGPTGVGKTTTVAKLAADFALRDGQRVGLIAADTYRIGAMDQLRTYADIIGVPMHAVHGPEDVPAVLKALADCDVVLIDTAGRAPRDAERISELAETLDAASPDETHLVLSAAAAEPVAQEAATRFANLRPTCVTFTKIDEALQFGLLLNVSRAGGIGLRYLTTGQDVPDNIERATGERVAACLLGVEGRA